MAVLDAVHEVIHRLDSYGAHPSPLSLEFHLSIHQSALHPHAEARFMFCCIAIEELCESGLELVVDNSQLPILYTGLSLW